MPWELSPECRQNWNLYGLGGSGGNNMYLTSWIRLSYIYIPVSIISDTQMNTIKKKNCTNFQHSWASWQIEFFRWKKTTFTMGSIMNLVTIHWKSSRLKQKIHVIYHLRCLEEVFIVISLRKESPWLLK